MFPIDKKSVLVQVMAWRQTGDNPLPEPMMTEFIDAYMRLGGMGGGGGVTLRVPTVMFAKHFLVSNGFHIKVHVNMSIIIFGVFPIETYP